MTITFDSLCDAIGIAAKEAALHLEGNGRSLTVLKSHTVLNSDLGKYPHKRGQASAFRLWRRQGSQGRSNR